jgi:transcriptional regulator with XRE-family HTH domain
MDLGLMVKDVARLVGATPQSVAAWERGRMPDTDRMPAIIDFLGYAPWDPRAPLCIRLRSARRALGLTQVRLAFLAGMDPTQVADWESGRHAPSDSSVSRLWRALARAAEETLLPWHTRRGRWARRGSLTFR